MKSASSVAGRVKRFVVAKADPLIASGVGLAAFLLYLRTMAPSVACIFCDSLEFQLVTYKLGIAHPTGYPLYTLLGKLFTFLPVGDVAYRVNLMSAFFGALTVALLYLTLRLALEFRVPALLGALGFAVSPVFWSQAVMAEVYTLNSAFLALVVFLLLRWKEIVERGESGEVALRALALVYGLSQTHHRYMLLLAPAMVIFIWIVDRSVFRKVKELARLGFLFVAPLSLYLYIAIRGFYVPTEQGGHIDSFRSFIDYVTGAILYRAVRSTPFPESRDLAFYIDLLSKQFGLVGIALGLLGLLWLLRRSKVSLFLVLAVAVNLAFTIHYQVYDIHVFLIPIFLIWSIWIGGGFTLLWEVMLAILGRMEKMQRLPWQHVSYATLLVVGTLLPWTLFRENHQAVDLSRQWWAHDQGVDMLSQPLEEEAVVVGILGEMTLLRYFQETENLRPDIITVAADFEAERLAAVEEQLEAAHPVYLTRRLPGAEERWHLSSLGPLIRVRERPATVVVSPQVDSNISLRDGLLLLGYDSTFRESHSRLGVRVNLYWQAQAEVEEFWLSLRLVDSKGHLAGQVDSPPVQGAYPTTAWQPGETIVDSYDVPVLSGVPPGEYSLEVVLYRPQTLEEVGRSRLGEVVLPKSFALPGMASLGVEKVTRVNFGNRIRLVGYSLGGGEFRPGDGVPLTFLWQSLGDLGECSPSLWLQDETGKKWGERAFPLGGEYPSPFWERGQLVRHWQTLLLPADLPDGRYQVRMQVVKGGKPLSRLYGLMPLGSTFDLGAVEVKGRERSFALPSIRHPLDFRLGEVVRLLGYDLEPVKVEPGGSVDLTLYWQALSTMEVSYTVFIHLLNKEGELWGQRDSIPGAGSLPTTGWISGEVVTDRYDIPIASDTPPGEYTLLLGMYEPISGKRLPVYDRAGNEVGDSLTLEGVEVSR